MEQQRGTKQRMAKTEGAITLIPKVPTSALGSSSGRKVSRKCQLRRSPQGTQSRTAVVWRTRGTRAREHGARMWYTRDATGRNKLWIERATRIPSFLSLENPFVRRSKERHRTVVNSGVVLRNGLPRNRWIESVQKGWDVRERGQSCPGMEMREPRARPPRSLIPLEKRGFKANTKAVDKKFRPVKTVVSRWRDTVLDSDSRLHQGNG